MKKANTFYRGTVLLFFALGSLITKSQEIEKIFLTFPDKNFEEVCQDVDKHFFSKEIREAIMTKENFHEDKSGYFLTEALLYKQMNNEEMDELESNDISIEINKSSNRVKANYYSENSEVSIDFFLCNLSEKGYSLFIIMQFPGILGNPTQNYVSEYIFSKSTNSYTKKEIILPKLSWSDFFDKTDLEGLNMYYLEDVEIEFDYTVYCLNNNNFVTISPNLDNIIIGYIGMLNHEFENEPNEMQDFQMTGDSLGIYGIIQDFFPLFSIPSFTKVNYDQFLMMYYFDLVMIEKFNVYKPYTVNYYFPENLWKVNVGSDLAKWNINEGILKVSSESNNVEAYYLSVFESDKGKVLAVINSNKGFMSSSKIFFYSISGNKLKPLETGKILPEIKQDWLGIVDTKNVFKELQDFFAPDFLFSNKGITVSLLVNPSMGNSEAEAINNKLPEEEKTVLLKWNKSKGVFE